MIGWRARKASQSGPGWQKTILFLLGCSLTTYEALIHEGPERWGLLVIYAAMMGVTVIAHQEDKHQPPPTREDEPA